MAESDDNFGDFYDNQPENPEIEQLFAPDPDIETEDSDPNVDLGLKPFEAKFKIITGLARKSERIMTRFEYSRLISTRANQIVKGSPIHPEVKSESDDPITLAALEMKVRKNNFPILLHRPMPDGSVEEWDVGELILPEEAEVYELEGLTI